MNIIFLGEDSFSAVVATSLIEKGYSICMIATLYYDDFLYKRLEIVAQKNNIPFFREPDINAPNFVARLKEINPDLIITAHFKKLLKKELISVPKIGCLNLHPSLLPMYRGMAPQHWPIINGDIETGLSVHYIEEGIDTGNILIQKKIPIDPHIYVHDLQMQMLPYYRTVVAEAINKIESNNGIGEKQDITKGSFYGKFKKKDAEIKKDTKKNYAYNLIRAISKPYMGAYFEDYKLWKAHLLQSFEEKELMKKFLKIGMNFEKDGTALLRLTDGVLIIDNYEKSENT